MVTARAFLIALLLVAALSAPAGADVRETTEIVTYTVRGAVAADVRANMNEQRGSSGFDALTTWHVRWHFTYQRTGGSCAITKVSTDLALVYRLPRLETDNAALRDSFDRYLTKLRSHEDGHADNGRRVAARVDRGILDLAAAATCDELSQAANAFGDSVIADGKANDVAYDAETQHGRTQGARWP